jgi:hypothetical protein
MLLTLALGVIGASWWREYHRSAPTSLLSKQLPVQVPPFSGGEFTSAFQDHYFSTEGAHIHYGCYGEVSPSRAAKALRIEVGLIRIKETGPHLTLNGDRDGTRVITENPSDMEPNASSIFWTEGQYLFTIRAPSLKSALEFEKWMGDSQYRMMHCF